MPGHSLIPRRNSLCTFLLGLAVFFIQSVSADVYKVVDEQGRVTYTDSPPKGLQAEKLELKESNSLPPVAARAQPPRSQQEPENTDYQLRIVFPPPAYHLNPGQRSLSVQVAVEPALSAEHRLQITDNGQPVQGTTLENIVVRGAHTLQARVVDARGRVLAESAPVQFFVHRPSVAN